MIPTLVIEEILDAVRTAIQFGVSAEEFKKLVREAWAQTLADKTRWDDKELSI